jgi:hypothetical protein
MADRHLEGMRAAIDRLEQVLEELDCSDYKQVVKREIFKVERKKIKIIKKFLDVKYGV